VLVEHLLDLAGVHVVAAADDYVLGPVDDVVVAVLVAAGQVSAAEPAVADGRCRGLGLVQVALHHVVSLDRDLTDLTLGNLDPLVSMSLNSTPSMGWPTEPGFRTGRRG